MTVKHEIPPPIDPLAFGLAFLGAPILATLLVSAPGLLGIALGPLLIFPVIGGIALLAGGPVYLALGLPVLLVAAHYRPLTSDNVIGWATATALAVVALCGLASIVMRDLFPQFLLSCFALLFAPFWGWMFAVIYDRLSRPSRLS